MLAKWQLLQLSSVTTVSLNSSFDHCGAFAMDGNESNLGSREVLIIAGDVQHRKERGWTSVDHSLVENLVN